ncbi:MAG: DUF3604 domain-containing protein [FCB group bacterium]|nr:DUF3604 domain-containing protein [FCB group bacterium]
MKRFISFVLLFVFLALTLLPAKTSLYLPLSGLGAEDKQISSHFFCEYPDITIDRDGKQIVVYTELSDGKEQIRLEIFDDMELKKTYDVSPKGEHEFRGRVYTDIHNNTWISWAAKRDNNWDIYLRCLNADGKLEKEIRLSDDAAVDLNPEIAGDASGNIWVVWESNRNGKFDIFLKMISSGGEKKLFAISESEYMDLRPALAVDKRGQVIIAWDRQVEDSYRVMSRKIKKDKLTKEERISSEYGFNVAPSVAVDKRNRRAIAWHSNLQPDQKVGLTPWVHIKRSGFRQQIYTPAEANDWKQTGEEQGFEFPELIFDNEGRLWVFGRPSQGFYAQCIDGKNKSAIYTFHVPGWGGRGQYAKAAIDAEGKIVTVRRDWRHMYMNRFDPSAKDIVMDGSLKPVYETREAPETFYANKKHDIQLRSEKKILYGDIHQHSSVSDGRGTIDEQYTRSRYCYGQDFAALTDHEWFVANYLFPSEWEWIKIIGQQFNEPGVFTAIAAYEWTTPRTPIGFGHKNVYFKDWDKPIFSWRFDEKSSLSLFEFCKNHDAFAVPHHPGWTGTDWENQDPVAQPVAEIVSSHGANEYLGNLPIAHRGGVPGSFIQDALADGHVFGLIGGSDAHGLLTHHGISSKENEWETGLAAVIAEKNDIDHIFNAFLQRRVYATSGQNILVDFTINGHEMGKEIEVNAAPEINIEVVGTAPLVYVTLVRNNEDILFAGKDFYEGLGARKVYVDEDLKPGRYWYYLRVVQEDGEMAWSSPIWVTVKK